MAENGKAQVMSPEEWLLERKLQIVKQANCKELFDQIREADNLIAAGESELSKVTLQLQAAKAQAEEFEDLAVLTVEGKNEAERKARRIEALRADPTYQAQKNQIVELGFAFAECRDTLETNRRNAKRLEMEIKYRVAILEAIR